MSLSERKDSTKENLDSSKGCMVQQVDGATSMLGPELGVQAVKEGEKVGSPGSRYIVFQVANLKRTITDLKKRTVPFTSPIKYNKDEGFEQITALDPDGNKLVFFQLASSASGDSENA